MSRPRVRSRKAEGVALLIDIIVPIGIYYVLRALGVGYYPALLASTLLPGVSVILDLVRRRRPESLSLLMMGLMIGSALISLISQDPRFLAARDGWFTGVTGVWFLVTVRGNRPLGFVFTRFILERRIGPGRPAWDEVWERLPAFRRVWRVVTVIWGVGLILDAGLRVAVAYTLPIDTVVGLQGVLYVGFLAIMQVAVNVYLVPVGIYNQWSAFWAPLRVDPDAEDARDQRTLNRG